MNKKILSIIAVLVILGLPLIASTYGTQLATDLFIMSLFALSLGLIMGFAGLASFGQAAFFGLGVYTVALLGQYVENTYLLMLAAVFVAGFFALVSGMLFIRSTGAYLIMLTLAFNQLLYVVIYKMTNITGGADGLSITVTPDLGFGEILDPMSLYYFVSIAFIIIFAFLHYYVHSPTGKIVYGAKENNSRMKALGYNTYYYKVLTYTIGGMIAGFSGALYGYFNAFASPESIHWILSGQALIMVIIGGAGTLVGPPIGAAIYVVLQNYISSYTERWPIIMGLLFIAVVLYNRGGIAHLLEKGWNRSISYFSKFEKSKSVVNAAKNLEEENIGGK